MGTKEFQPQRPEIPRYHTRISRRPASSQSAQPPSPLPPSRGEAASSNYQGGAARLGRNPQETPRPHSQAAARPTPQGRASPVPQGHPATTAGEQVVRTSIPVRSTSADRGSEDNPAADHARVAHLRRLRQIMEEVYRLFDRRCRTETALARLAQLRGRVSRCKRLGRALDKLSSPNLEKALTFLDDKLLPATSNAVERSNRRYRKAQKSIYSVRTAEHIRQRIALDMQRDQQGPIAHRPRRPCIRPVLGRKTPRMMLQSRDFASVSRSSPDSSRGVGTPAPWPPSPTAAGRGRSSVSPNRYDWRC